ncbi:MAG: SURF1 family cytochrome oxidase biogenesis protein [Caulobacterales bacterium]
MLSFRPLPIMSLFAVVALAILVAMGSWQWRRYEDKVRAAKTPPAEMTLVEYSPLPEGLQLVYGVRDSEPGWRVFAPVRDGDTVVFVDSDFVPGPEAPSWRDIRYPRALTYDAPIQGASVRPGPPSVLASPPRPMDRIWYDIDLDAMARTAGLGQVADYYIAAPYVGADGRTQANPFARILDPLPPERHLGYAVTWWGLALMLVGVYFAYHISVGRLRLRPAEAE